MLVKLWIVFSCLSTVTQSKYYFRYHTCIAEDQELLKRENLLSLKQVAFIDDGTIIYHDLSELEGAGIRIESGEVLSDERHNLTGYEEGGESAHRVVTFNGFDKFIVINLWSHTYYVMRKGDNYSLSEPTAIPIKPDLMHFVRVYFVCVPGNSKSALILFGPQSKLRKIMKNPRVKRGEMKANKTEVINEQNQKIIVMVKNKLRLTLHLVCIFVGFTLAIPLNGVVLLIFTWMFKDKTSQDRNEKTEQQKNQKKDDQKNDQRKDQKADQNKNEKKDQKKTTVSAETKSEKNKKLISKV